jgi:2-dehydro-3-deoxy-D-arabinonate dehydratase
MPLAKVRRPDGRVAVVRLHTGHAHELTLSAEFPTLAAVLHAADPAATATELSRDAAPEPADRLHFLHPVDAQEVWAAGVTYKRSKVAREEESVGAAQFYDRVYTAPRPELFLKATPRRVRGPGEPIRVRADATWSVPEPEFTLVISPAGKVVGYTIGNDVSSRDIEGENPLYLPQAKVYTGSCAIGPWVALPGELPALESVSITLTIRRGGSVGFTGSTTLAQLTRTPESLADWLFRDNDFPDGAFLMTGTGIVPPDSFTLSSGDEVDITIDALGTLTNRVE